VRGASENDTSNENKTPPANPNPFGNLPMVFMNSGGGGGGGGGGSSASSSSSAAASAAPSPTGGRNGAYPRQSFLIHLLLFCFTAGIGNVIYYLHVRNKQAQWHNNNIK